MSDQPSIDALGARHEASGEAVADDPTPPQLVEPTGVDAPDEPSAPDPHTTELRNRRWSGLALLVLVAGAAYVAPRLHRDGHTVGDDFALYLRQARSIFEGNIHQVISDNRLLWANSTGVTPAVYPWIFPLILSPFVHFWGLDYARLKLVEVAFLCAWLVLFHGIVRRRAGRIVAFALTAVFATAIPYLSYTDQLLTEIPYMLAVAAAIWWLDRLLAEGSLLERAAGRLVVLGLLAVFAYNVRREGIVLLVVFGIVQLIDVVGRLRARHQRGEPLVDTVKQLPWKLLLLPHVTFVVGTVLFQILLPSTLLPKRNNARKWVGQRVLGIGDDRRDRSYPRELMLQLGLGESRVESADWVARYGLGLLVIAGIGVILACVYKPRLNLPIAAYAVATLLIIGTHPRWVGRYYLQVTPFVAFFALMTVFAGGHLIRRALARDPDRFRTDSRIGTPTGRRIGLAIAAVTALPALWVAAVHVKVLPDRIDTVAARNALGPQMGPVHPTIIPAYDAVLAHTGPDDTIIYYRARTMTLYTDRRSFQVGSVARAERLGDFFMVNRTSNYSQPPSADLAPELLEARGWLPVWQDATWTLWKLPESDFSVPIRTNTVFERPIAP